MPAAVHSGMHRQTAGNVNANAIAAEAGYVRSQALIVTLTALLVGLTFLAFRRHLDAYRYRSA